MTEPTDSGPPSDLGGQPDRDSGDLLAEIARRVAIAGRLLPAGTTAVLRSVVDATVVLFDAEAASLALYDQASGTLVFEVAAGSQGDAVVGVSIAPDSGVAGYVFTTGQPLALSDVANDSRFGRATAEQTGYVPRSLVAVPLIDEEGTIGVLEVLDKRSGQAFDLRDVELAGVFAHQAAVAIRTSRLERETRSLLRSSLVALAADRASDVDDLVERAVREVDDDDDPIWRLVDQIARLRTVAPGDIELMSDLLAVLVARAERGRTRPHGRST
jgi:GAF domain-containing protein